MKVIVGNMTYKLRDFIKNYQFTSRIIVINKMCNVKTIKGKVEVFIPFGRLEKNGLILGTQVNLEELLMSLNVETLYYGNLKNKEEIEEIGNRYDVNVVYLDINNLDRGILL